MKLWLDDERPAPDGWYGTKDPYEALSWIRSGCVDVASLDHDLGAGVESGYWLLARVEADMALGLDYALPRFSVHSANPVGRARMESAVVSIERLAA